MQALHARVQWMSLGQLAGALFLVGDFYGEEGASVTAA